MFVSRHLQKSHKSRLIWRRTFRLKISFIYRICQQETLNNDKIIYKKIHESTFDWISVINIVSIQFLFSLTRYRNRPYFQARTANKPTTWRGFWQLFRRRSWTWLCDRNSNRSRSRSRCAVWWRWLKKKNTFSDFDNDHIDQSRAVNKNLHKMAK